MDDMNLTDDEEKPTPGKCTGNCKIRGDMFMSVCLTCGADDWGSDTTEYKTEKQ